MSYFKRKGSDTYHTERCHLVPCNVGRNPNWEVRRSKPRGDKCNHCKKHIRFWQRRTWIIFETDLMREYIAPIHKKCIVVK